MSKQAGNPGVAWDVRLHVGSHLIVHEEATVVRDVPGCLVGLVQVDGALNVVERRIVHLGVGNVEGHESRRAVCLDLR